MKMTADKEIAKLVEDLRNLKALQKQMKKQEESIIRKLALLMQENEELITDDGEIMLTWKWTKESEMFDSLRFKEENPDIYSKYIKQKSAYRRLELK